MKKSLTNDIREALKERNIPYIYNPYHFQFIIMGDFRTEFRVYGNIIIPLIREDIKKVEEILKELKINNYVLQ